MSEWKKRLIILYSISFIFVGGIWGDLDACGPALKELGQLAHYYRVLASNTSLSEARVVFVGDTHTRGYGRDGSGGIERQNTLVNAIASPGDIVVFESPPLVHGWSSVDANRLTIRQDLTPLGWDNERLNQFAETLHRGMVEIIRRTNGFRNATESDFLAYGRALIRFEHAGIVMRNREMDRVVTQARRDHPTKRIFVLAGTIHISEQNPAIERLNSGSIPYLALSLVDSDGSRERSAQSSQRIIEDYENKTGQTAEDVRRDLEKEWARYQ